MSFNFYADDSQIYMPLKKNGTIRWLLECLNDIQAWMSLNFLCFNIKKTEVVRAFAVAAPKLWNYLPLPVRQASSLSSFKSLLKTHLFSLAFDTRHVF